MLQKLTDKQAESYWEMLAKSYGFSERLKEFHCGPEFAPPK
jgi:hypothetical protein